MKQRGRYQAEVERLRADDEGYQKLELALTVASELRLVMERTGVSQAELARRLRVSAQFVSRLLRDEGHNMTLGTLARVAKALRVRLAWRFDHLAEEDPPSPLRRDWSWTCSSPADLTEESTHALRLAA
jgi:transcriptional regulator with XRE-family HTH domain